MDAAITTAFEQAVNRDLGFDEVRALAQSIKAGTGEPRDLAAALARAECPGSSSAEPLFTSCANAEGHLMTDLRKNQQVYGGYDGWICTCPLLQVR